MVIKSPTASGWPSPKKMHARRCFLLGITEPDKVARLWEEERQKIEAAQKSRPRGRNWKAGG